MTQAKTGDMVRVHYTGRLSDGREFDSSAGRDPLEFTIGSRSLMPAFEDAVIGLDVGQSESLTVPAADAYGARSDDAVQTVERSIIPPEVELEIGKLLQATAPGGKQIILTVVEMTDDTVTLDGNHPLAGEDLTFDIKLVEVL